MANTYRQWPPGTTTPIPAGFDQWLAQMRGALAPTPQQRPHPTVPLPTQRPGAPTPESIAAILGGGAEAPMPMQRPEGGAQDAASAFLSGQTQAGGPPAPLPLPETQQGGGVDLSSLLQRGEPSAAGAPSSSGATTTGRGIFQGTGETGWERFRNSEFGNRVGDMFSGWAAGGLEGGGQALMAGRQQRRAETAAAGDRTANEQFLVSRGGFSPEEARAIAGNQQMFQAALQRIFAQPAGPEYIEGPDGIYAVQGGSANRIAQFQQQPGSASDRYINLGGGLMWDSQTQQHIRAPQEDMTPNLQVLMDMGLTETQARAVATNPQAFTQALQGILPQPPPDPTTNMRDYEAYAADERAAGRQPLSRLEYEQELRSSSATRIENNLGPSGIDYGNPPTNHAWKRGADGTIVLDERGLPIAELVGQPHADAQAATAAGAEAAENSAAQARFNAGVIVTSIDDALHTLDTNWDFFVTGLPGRVLANLGGQAANLEQSLLTVQAQTGLQQLREMREASGNGASGLGQVTQTEHALLQAMLGSVSNIQDATQLRQHLNRIRLVYADVLNGGRLSEWSRTASPSEISAMLRAAGSGNAAEIDRILAGPATTPGASGTGGFRVLSVE